MASIAGFESADKIKEIEAEDPNLYHRNIIGIADPAIWQADGGVSHAEMFERNGVYWNKGDNTRLAGKMQLHYRFAFDSNGYPLFYVFKTCRNFIRTVPMLVYSDVDVEDVNTASEDHIYDECRYVCMANPVGERRKGIGTRDAPCGSVIYKPSAW